MLPEGAVRQKLTGDGYAPADIEAFLSGAIEFIAAPMPPSSAAAATPSRPPLAQMLAQTPTLRSVPTSPTPVKTASPHMSLLQAIQQGPKLRAVVKEEAPATPKITGGGGLLGMLAMEMSKRRFNMNQREESDSDSDGFSDSDSDSD